MSTVKLKFQSKFEKGIHFALFIRYGRNNDFNFFRKWAYSKYRVVILVFVLAIALLIAITILIRFGIGLSIAVERESISSLILSVQLL